MVTNWWFIRAKKKIYYRNILKIRKIRKTNGNRKWENSNRVIRLHSLANVNNNYAYRDEKKFFGNTSADYSVQQVWNNSIKRSRRSIFVESKCVLSENYYKKRYIYSYFRLLLRLISFFELLYNRWCIVQASRRNRIMVTFTIDTTIIRIWKQRRKSYKITIRYFMWDSLRFDDHFNSYLHVSDCHINSRGIIRAQILLIGSWL